jgi:hypothetical protein
MCTMGERQGRFEVVGVNKGEKVVVDVHTGVNVGEGK